MPANHWYLLIHQLPPKPAYLRARVRERLARVGAIALKNSVYVLPRTDECLEDLEWIAQEARAGGGDAWVCQSDFVDGITAEELEKRFTAERHEDYESVAAEAKELLATLKKRSGAEPPEEDAAAGLARLRKRLGDLVRIDFFSAPGRRPAEAALAALSERLERKPPAPAPKGAHAELVGKTWVTRRGIQVDRIGSAWLVRRFVDPNARFRFVDPKGFAPAAGEVRYDMMPAEFTHEGDRCTFETLVARAGIADPAVREIAEIVHDVDLKDGKFARPDAPGVQRLLSGLVLSHPEDEDRLAHGFSLFDDLYRSFSASDAVPPAPKKARARPKGGRT